MRDEIKQRLDRLRQGQVPKGYKKTKHGIIPFGWSVYTIEELYTERKESGIPTLPILTVSIHTGVSDGALDDDELGKKVKRIEDKTQYRTARTGDVVFNMMRAWQGAIGVVRQDGLVSPAYIVATPSGIVHPPFMDYCLKTPQMINRLHRKSYGVTDFRLRLYWDSFAKVECVLPPLPEQQKIAEILSAQDKLIALKEKLIEEKKRQKKYLMQQLLTGKKRLPGFSGEWASKKIGAILKIRHGHSQHEVEDINGKYPILGTGGIIGHSNTYLYNKPSVLIGRKGTIDKPQYMEIPFWTIDTLFYSEIFENYVPRFVYYMFCNIDWNIYNEASGVPSLNSNTIENIKIEIPDYDEQIAIVQVLSTIDREIDLLSHDLDQEKQKKKALMQLLLTGIVRVTP